MILTIFLLFRSFFTGLLNLRVLSPQIESSSIVYSVYLKGVVNPAIMSLYLIDFTYWPWKSRCHSLDHVLFLFLFHRGSVLILFSLQSLEILSYFCTFSALNLLVIIMFLQVESIECDQSHLVPLYKEWILLNEPCLFKLACWEEEEECL